MARHKIDTTSQRRRRILCCSTSPERGFSGHISDVFQAEYDEGSGLNVILKINFFCQGAIFLYYDGRIKQVQGNLVEVSTLFHEINNITLQFPLDSFYGYFCAGIYVGSPDFSDARIIM